MNENIDTFFKDTTTINPIEVFEQLKTLARNKSLEYSNIKSQQLRCQQIQ